MGFHRAKQRTPDVIIHSHPARTCGLHARDPEKEISRGRRGWLAIPDNAVDKDVYIYVSLFSRSIKCYRPRNLIFAKNLVNLNFSRGISLRLNEYRVKKSGGRGCM